jgi:predicted P-loop ATPase
MKKQEMRFRRRIENKQKNIKKIVEQVKNELKDSDLPHDTTEQLMDYLKKNYDFRYNTMMGYTEYREKGMEDCPWLPVEQREVNTFTLKAKLEGIRIWNNDTWRYVMSKEICDYHPVTDYLESVRGKWDGKDHIGMLAACVKTTCPGWNTLFRRWMLAMVAQWMNKNKLYGNAIAPLFISGQGYNKSTFCRSILPPELSWGYMDNLQMAEKKQVMLAMNQMLLINLDEFNQISPAIQSGFLKNVIQLATVKMKRPYGKHVEDFPRMASFIATTNMTDILSDPTGNRRFIGVELTTPIDVSTPPCHEQLYAQILHLLESGERYWFNNEETQDIMEFNKNYQLKSGMEMLFENFFELTTDEKKGKYMNTTTIYEYLKRHGGNVMSDRSLIHFGRTLSNINGIVRRRGKRGSEYLVIMK